MPDAALEELSSFAGLARPEPGAVEISGDDSVLPTRFRIGAAGAAAIAAAAIAAAGLLALRTAKGRRQTVAVDVRHAVAALRSTRHLRIDGAAPKDPRDPVSGL
jgi:hypothetical protein